jgi:transposase
MGDSAASAVNSAPTALVWPGPPVTSSSRRVQAYLGEHGSRFELHFLPPYSPEHNDIERLWREVHANVTRNHRCKTIDKLMHQVSWHLRRHAARLRQSTLIHQRGTPHARLAA